jgi:tetratricopeptide (TPR) repeat protein
MLGQIAKQDPTYPVAVECFDCGNALSDLGCYEAAITAYDQALTIKPDYPKAFNNKGNALYALGRKEEAIAAYDQALTIKPDDARAHYNKACCYGLQKNIDLAIETLQQSITLDSERREMAQTDSDFDGIREDDRFQALMGE